MCIDLHVRVYVVCLFDIYQCVNFQYYLSYENVTHIRGTTQTIVSVRIMQLWLLIVCNCALLMVCPTGEFGKRRGCSGVILVCIGNVLLINYFTQSEPFYIQ